MAAAAADDAKCVVGIDFGTSGTAFAYSFTDVVEVVVEESWEGSAPGTRKARAGRRPTRVWGAAWPLGTDASALQVHTGLILDEEDKVVAFGDVARKKFVDNSREHRGWLYFERVRAVCGAPRHRAQPLLLTDSAHAAVQDDAL
jgi:hypothetical protein